MSENAIDLSSPNGLAAFVRRAGIPVGRELGWEMRTAGLEAQSVFDSSSVVCGYKCDWHPADPEDSLAAGIAQEFITASPSPRAARSVFAHFVAQIRTSHGANAASQLLGERVAPLGDECVVMQPLSPVLAGLPPTSLCLVVIRRSVAVCTIWSWAGTGDEARDRAMERAQALDALLLQLQPQRHDESPESDPHSAAEWLPSARRRALLGSSAKFVTVRGVATPTRQQYRPPAAGCRIGIDELLAMALPASELPGLSFARSMSAAGSRARTWFLRELGGAPDPCAGSQVTFAERPDQRELGAMHAEFFLSFPSDSDADAALFQMRVKATQAEENALNGITVASIAAPDVGDAAAAFVQDYDSDEERREIGVLFRRGSVLALVGDVAASARPDHSVTFARARLVDDRIRAALNRRADSSDR
jgi:hypothetical protein